MASRASASRLDVKELLEVLLAVRAGDFAVRLRGDLTGVPGKAADVLNQVIAMNAALAGELKRLAHAVGKQGRTRERAVLANASGAWADSVTVTSAWSPGSGVTNWVSRSSEAPTATVRPFVSPYNDVSRLSIDRCPCHV